MYSSSQPSHSTGASYISRVSTPEPPRPKSRHRSQNKDSEMSKSRKRSSSRGSSRSRSDQRESKQIHLQDCEHLIREEWVSLPGGFTRQGSPLLVFPDKSQFNYLHVTDLHTVLQYYINVVPRSEQSPGFALIIDRRSDNWQWRDIQGAFSKIVAVFPGNIKEVFLLYKYPEGKPVLGQLVDDYLLDFDIFHVSNVSELPHYVDPKYLGEDLGGSAVQDVDQWLLVQENVDSFTVSATKCARRMATFVKILNKEDISTMDNRDNIREIAERNRGCYRKLRTELESLTESGICLNKKLVMSGASVMQRLTVEMLCNQLDNTWKYFTATFKMQDQLYVQYVEIFVFNGRFEEIANKFSDNEKLIKKLSLNVSSIDEVNHILDQLDSVIDALAVDALRAKKLSKFGKDLMAQHPFTQDLLEARCAEIKVMCKRQEMLLLEKRRILLKLLDLFEALDNMSKWCDSAEHHLSKDQTRNSDEQDLLSQIRQIEYLMSKARDVKIRGRLDFEEDFDEIKDIISAKTLFKTDDHIQRMEDVKNKVISRLEILREKAAEQEDSIDEASIVDLAARRENIIEEMLHTEMNYVDDLKMVLSGYRDKLELSNLKLSMSLKTDLIFGNLDEIWEFHADTLLPQLESCHLNPTLIAKTFLEYSQHLTRMYCRYCQNMESAQTALSEVGDNHPILLGCQKELGHQLPLSSYLLKPMQRLTKYQLLLKDLSDTFTSCANGQFELEESVEAMVEVIKAVNDSLHQINIKGLPEVLHPLGSLVCQESFSVLTENKTGTGHIFRNKQQIRHLLLYENHLIFCKAFSDKHGVSYQFKFSLAIANLGMSSVIKGDDKKLEIWIIGQSDVYSLGGKTRKAKEDFAVELRNVIIKQKERNANRPVRISQSIVYNEQMSTTSGVSSESLRSRRSNFCHSRSMELETTTDGRDSSRSHSLDPHHDRSSSEADLMDSPRPTFPQYRVLADYTALTSREVNLHEGEVVELVKIGCAGWWYVRLTGYNVTEGWAPSTYMEKLPARYRTLDRP